LLVCQSFGVRLSVCGCGDPFEDPERECHESREILPSFLQLFVRQIRVKVTWCVVLMWGWRWHGTYPRHQFVVAKDFKTYQKEACRGRHTVASFVIFGRRYPVAMTQPIHLGELAARYHAELSTRIREYLNARGIPDSMIDRHHLGWSGRRITIPIFNREGQIVFFKFAKDPGEEHAGPKMLASRGSTLELYGWEVVLAKPASIIICEGEFDRLVLEAQGFDAVTSTGGAGKFRPEWATDFKEIPEVYICFDRDEAGERGALRVARLIPQAKLVTLPPDVGEGGDVTDFFVRLGFDRADFVKRLEEAGSPAPHIYEEPKPSSPSSPDRERIERVKRAVRIEELIGKVVALRPSGGMLVGLCPFHEDHIPSLTVYPRTGTFHCYGCLKHGDVIDFVRYREDLSFKEAMDRLETMTTEHGGQPQ